MKGFFKDGGYITGVGGLLAAPTVQSYPQGRPFKFLNLYLQVVTIITKLQKRTKCYIFKKFLKSIKSRFCNYRYNRHNLEIGFAFFLFVFLFSFLTLVECMLLRGTHGK